MKLYKNVRLEDLAAILAEGIQPIAKTGNNDWEEGRRGENSTNVVYLARPTGNENSFTQYGFVLVEVETDGATPVDMLENDANAGKYDEFIADEVAAEEITAVYMPALLRARIEASGLLNAPELARVTWVDMAAKIYRDVHGRVVPEYESATADELRAFANSAELTGNFNYFRGSVNGQAVDLYEIHYAI